MGQACCPPVRSGRPRGRRDSSDSDVYVYELPVRPHRNHGWPSGPYHGEIVEEILRGRPMVSHLSLATRMTMNVSN